MLIIADNIRITRKTVHQALETLDENPIRELVQICIENGAGALDLNPGPLTKTPERMAFLVSVVQEITDIPILLDSANPKALEEGLRVCKNPAIINGFSPEPGKLEHILPLAEKYQTRIIGYLLTEKSLVPTEETTRLQIAYEIFRAAKDAGVPQENLIIDPVLSPLSWEDGLIRNQKLLSVIQNLPELLGFQVDTIVGLSNLTTGEKNSRTIQRLEQVFLSIMAGSGLSMVLMDVQRADTVKTAKICTSLLGSGVVSMAQFA